MLRVDKDGWLSDVLQRPSWKVDGIADGISAANLRSLMLETAAGGDAFFSTKIPTLEVGAVKNAASAGFDVVDVNVTLDWIGAGASKAVESKHGILVESAGADDAGQIEDIAGSCFQYTRFHLDPAIGPGPADKIKRRWAGNACRGRASAVYVARENGVTAGFLAVLERQMAGRRDAIIDLIGVDTARQGRGVGRIMCRTFVDDWRTRADRLRVGTQVANVPALRLYESIGFRVAETVYVLHAHIRNGVVAA